MNDGTDQDTLRLKRMLEEITAADSPAASDAESASLREAWLAFGRLVDAADASLPAMPAAMPDLAALARRKPRRGRWISLIAAIAALLLAAVTLGWLVPGGVVTPSPGIVGVAPAPGSSDVASAGNTPVAAGVAEPAQPKAATAASSTWDDPLETQIAAVSEQIRSVEQNWQRGVDDADLVLYRIDEVTESLQDDKL
jgi:hypothetical protein